MIEFDDSPKYFIEWKPGKSLERIKDEAYFMSLMFHEGNRTHAAKSLGVSVRTLRKRIVDSDLLAQFRHVYPTPAAEGCCEKDGCRASTDG